MKSFIFLITVLGCAWAELLTGDAFFVRYVNNYLNNSVRPCDNFYRHVCRPDKPYAEKLGGYSTELVKELIKKGAKELEKTREYTKFEKILLSLGDAEDIELAFSILPDDITEDPSLEDGSDAAVVYRNMLQRMQFLKAIPHTHIFAPRQFMHEIIQKAEKEFEVSLLLNNRTLDRFRETLATLISDIYDTYGSKTYQDIFNNLDKFFKGTGSLEKFNETNIQTDFVEFLKFMGVYGKGLLNLQPLAPTLFQLQDRTLVYNAFYWSSDNSVHFYDPEIVLCINASIPAKYGSIGYTMGHEMFHSILNISRISSDLQLAQHTVCLANHMEEVCNEFSEGTCHSGALTYNEDAADMEAIQLLFKMMKDKLGKGLKDKFEGTSVTNEQMFFYAVAMELCDPEGPDEIYDHPKSWREPSGYDGHSTGIPRVNGISSLLNAFHEAFECEAGDRMFDIAVGRERCNAFGEPVRR